MAPAPAGDHRIEVMPLGCLTVCRHGTRTLSGFRHILCMPVTPAGFGDASWPRRDPRSVGFMGGS